MQNPEGWKEEYSKNVINNGRYADWDGVDVEITSLYKYRDKAMLQNHGIFRSIEVIDLLTIKEHGKITYSEDPETLLEKYELSRLALYGLEKKYGYDGAVTNTWFSIKKPWYLDENYLEKAKTKLNEAIATEKDFNLLEAVIEQRFRRDLLRQASNPDCLDRLNDYIKLDKAA